MAQGGGGGGAEGKEEGIGQRREGSDLRKWRWRGEG